MGRSQSFGGKRGWEWIEYPFLWERDFYTVLRQREEYPNGDRDSDADHLAQAIAARHHVSE